MSFSFVGGGARSGKSALALRLALDAGPRRAFIATAQALDDEMRDRLRRHQAERGADFCCTLEAPLDLPAALRRLAADPALPLDAVLIDCLTLWISNLLLADEAADIQAQVADLRDAIAACPPTLAVILVSNEVGMGIVPMNALARRFRDETGWAHQTLAAAADAVYFGAFGLMLRLKPGPVVPA